MKKHYVPVIPVTEWPILKLTKNRKSFVNDITDESISRILDVTSVNESLSDEIARALYLEKIRVNGPKWEIDPPDDKEFWKQIRKQLLKIPLDVSKEDKQVVSEKILRKIVSRYSNEIVGRFEIPAFNLATKLVQGGFSIMLNTAADRSIKKLKGNQLGLEDRIVLGGNIEKLRKLAKIGTIVIVPTHFSHLDSLLIGWALEYLGLPGVTYGAGINMFNNAIQRYFFSRLGAYKLDRRKKNLIYLETLKTHSRLALEYGCNTLFYPGGTRSRSGSIDNKLKMGLLGTVIDAQKHNLRELQEKQKIFIIPLVFSYHLVLEASNLIESYLASEGQEKYLMRKDQFNSIRKIISFTWKLFSLGSEIHLSFGEPMDVFGNKVDEQGTSRDHLGREIDIRKYYYSEGHYADDEQRDQEYTKLLSQNIVKSFFRNNVVLSSHIVAFAAFERLKRSYKKLSLFELLRLPEEYRVIPYDFLKSDVTILIKQLFELAEKKKLKLANHINNDIDSVINHGLKNLGVYHTHLPLRKNKQGNLTSDNMPLLYYYHNRLEGYDLHKVIKG